MRSITVGLPDDVAERLGELARQALRRPRDQAAILLVDAVARAKRNADRQAGRVADAQRGR